MDRRDGMMGGSGKTPLKAARKSADEPAGVFEVTADEDHCTSIENLHPGRPARGIDGEEFDDLVQCVGDNEGVGCAVLRIGWAVGVLTGFQPVDFRSVRYPAQSIEFALGKGSPVPSFAELKRCPAKGLVK